MTDNRNIRPEWQWRSTEKKDGRGHFHVPIGGGLELAIYAGSVRFVDQDDREVVVLVELDETTPAVVVSDLRLKAAPGESLTVRGLQRWGLGDLFREAKAELGQVVDEAHRRVAGEHSVADQALDEASETNRSRGRPVSVTTDAYEAAARLYRAAQASGTSTTAAVADGLAVSRSTARKRVMGARERGLLPVAESTRPRL